MTQLGIRADCGIDVGLCPANRFDTAEATREAGGDGSSVSAAGAVGIARVAALGDQRELLVAVEIEVDGIALQVSPLDQHGSGARTGTWPPAPCPGAT